MDLGLPADISWYKLLTDWGSLIGGGFALIAGIIAYGVGQAQATATRQAAEMQVAAERKKHDLEIETIRKSLAIELRQIIIRCFGVHGSLKKRLLVEPEMPVTVGILESCTGVPIPIVYPAIADRIGLLGAEAMEVVIVYQLVEIARDAVRQLLDYPIPNRIAPMRVAAVAETFLQACLYAQGILPRLKTGIAAHEAQDNELMESIAEAQAVWGSIRESLLQKK